MGYLSATFLLCYLRVLWPCSHCASQSLPQGPNRLMFSYCLFSRELKDNLGSDEPEGDAPLLLQTMLARNPGIFREKSMEGYTLTHALFSSLFLLLQQVENLWCFSFPKQTSCSSSKWYRSTKSPRIPCIVQHSPETFSRQPFLPTHQGESRLNNMVLNQLHLHNPILSC